MEFKLFYRDTLDFNLPFEKRNFLKNKLKDICHKILIDNILNFPPILSDTKNTVYKLAKCLVPILLPLIVDDYNLKGSFSIAKEVINFDHCIVVYQHSHR